jgi:hypothetical protein
LTWLSSLLRGSKSEELVFMRGGLGERAMVFRYEDERRQVGHVEKKDRFDFRTNTAMVWVCRSRNNLQLPDQAVRGSVVTPWRQYIREST